MDKFDTLSKILSIPKNELEDTLLHQKKYVKKVIIKRKDGSSRKTYKAIEPLKKIQDQIKFLLQEIYLPSEFHNVKRRSSKTNAEIHLAKKYILKIDIKHYYPSINQERIHWLFTELGYSNQIADLLAQFTSIDRKLVTGFSTSPLIANFLFYKTLYPRIKGLCEQQNIEFSIFADDITFSRGRDLSSFKKLIRKIFNSEGFEINEKKFLLQKRNEHQEITGYVVNKKLNISKKEYKKIRTLLYKCKRDGIENATGLDREKANSHLMGKVQRVCEVNPLKGEKLKAQLNLLINS